MAVALSYLKLLSTKTACATRCVAAAVAASAAAAAAVAAPRGTDESAVLTLKKEEQRHNLESSCEMSIRPRRGRPEKRDFTYSLNVERSSLPVNPRGTIMCISIRIVDAKSSARLLTRMRVIRETQEPPGTITARGGVSKVIRLHGSITISSITMLL